MPCEVATKFSTRESFSIDLPFVLPLPWPILLLPLKKMLHVYCLLPFPLPFDFHLPLTFDTHCHCHLIATKLSLLLVDTLFSFSVDYCFFCCLIGPCHLMFIFLATASTPCHHSILPRPFPSLFQLQYSKKKFNIPIPTQVYPYPILYREDLFAIKDISQFIRQLFSNKP